MEGDRGFSVRIRRTEKRRDEADTGLPGVACSRRDRDGIELSRPVETPEGFLKFEGYIAKPGILTYARNGGTRELVRPETLHDPASLDTLKLKPVVLEHPIEGGQHVDVTPDNYQRHSVGTVGETWEVMPDGRVKFGFLVTARKAIDAIKRHGVRQLSPGYDLRFVSRPGEDPVFGRYDGEQLSRVYNHLALTLKARGGDDIGFRADSVRALPSLSLGGLTVHPLIAILLAAGVDRGALNEAQSRYDSLPDDKKPEKRADALADEIGDLKKKLDDEKARADGLAARLTDDALVAAFDQRLDLLDLAREARVDSAGLDKLGNDALARKVATALDPKLAADASDADVAATIRAEKRRFDSQRGGRRDSRRADDRGRRDSERAYEAAQVSGTAPERKRRDGRGEPEPEKRVDSHAAFLNRVAKARGE